MHKFKIIIFDADVGANVDEKTFNTSDVAYLAARDILNSYELEKEYADEREITENRYWCAPGICKKIDTMIDRVFFDSISVWLPGHHRKITIMKIEENN